MKKILITDYVHQRLIEGLIEMNYQVDYKPKISFQEVKDIIKEYVGIVINSKVKMQAETIDLATDLQFIARLGSGLEIIDVPYAEEKNIAVFNSPEGNRNAVGEHAMGMLLSLMNNLKRADQQVRNFEWNREQNRGSEIEGKTCGIIGFGHNGSNFGRKMAAFGAKVLAYDKYLTDFDDPASNIFSVNLVQLYKEADIISLHVPLTSDTHKMINYAFLENCKDGCIIINASRGKVIILEDLVEALEKGKIGGACLDVFENEKILTYSVREKRLYQRLFALENVVVSPHIAGWTKESLHKIATTLLQKISDWKLKNSK